MVNEFDVGDLVKLSCPITVEESGDPIDPGTLTLYVKKPGASEPETLVYGVDAAVVRTAEGEFHAVVEADTAGVWKYRWASTGNGQAAEERRFLVRASGVM